MFLSFFAWNFLSKKLGADVANMSIIRRDKGCMWILNIKNIGYVGLTIIPIQSKYSSDLGHDQVQQVQVNHKFCHGRLSSSGT